MRISRAAKCCTRSCLKRTESTTRVGYYPPPSRFLLLPLLLHLSFFFFCIASFQSQSCSCLIKYAAQHLICFFVFMFNLSFPYPSLILSAACFGCYHAALLGILAPSSCIRLAPPSHQPSHSATPLHTLAHLGPSDHASWAGTHFCNSPCLFITFLGVQLQSSLFLGMHHPDTRMLKCRRIC